MNYYERHLGDYARDAGHLTMLEHGAYTLLLDRYYTTEAGIPADQAYRVARARAKEEKQAVDTVLAEFFTPENGVWVKGRVQEEISKAQAKIKAAQENGKRGGRPKSGRSESGQNEWGQKPAGLSAASENETPACENKTKVEAHQTPDTRYQTEITGGGDNSQLNAAGQNQQTAPAANPEKPTAGEVCKALMQLKVSGINPGHAKLLVLLEAGAALEEFIGAAQDALAKNNSPGKLNFSYILGTVEGRRRDAKATAASIAQGALKPKGKPWYITASGIEAKAVELKIEKGRDEIFPDFKIRVLKAAGVTQEMVRQAGMDHGE